MRAARIFCGCVVALVVTALVAASSSSPPIDLRGLSAELWARAVSSLSFAPRGGPSRPPFLGSSPLVGSSRPKPTERAFVVQFEPTVGARSRLRGRVELVASGEAMRFRSLKQLTDLMASTLRKRAEI